MLGGAAVRQQRKSVSPAEAVGSQRALRTVHRADARCAFKKKEKKKKKRPISSTHLGLHEGNRGHSASMLPAQQGSKRHAAVRGVTQSHMAQCS
jgi:hypothetical protein